MLEGVDPVKTSGKTTDVQAIKKIDEIAVTIDKSDTV